MSAGPDDEIRPLDRPVGAAGPGIDPDHPSGAQPPPDVTPDEPHDGEHLTGEEQAAVNRERELPA